MQIGRSFRGLPQSPRRALDRRVIPVRGAGFSSRACVRVCLAACSSREVLVPQFVDRMPTYPITVELPVHQKLSLPGRELANTRDPLSRAPNESRRLKVPSSWSGSKSAIRVTWVRTRWVGVCRVRVCRGRIGRTGNGTADDGTRRDSGGDAAPTSPVISASVATAADVDVAVDVDVAAVDVRAVEVASVEVATVDVGAVEVAAVDVGAVEVAAVD